MEDSQPNEVRLSRKGSTIIPRVRISRPYPSKKPKWQPSSHDLVRVHLHLPRENAGNHDARKRWIEDQKYRLWTDRRLSVVSFKYLDHDNNRVQFTCRSQAIGHYDSMQVGSRLVNAHLDRERINITRQPKDEPAQSSDPGPSHVIPTSQALAGLGRCCQPLRKSPVPSSGFFIETRPVQLSTTGVKSSSVQVAHINVVPRHRAAAHTPPSTESIIDLTLGHSTPVVEDNSRWTTFRSGHIDIFLPPIASGSRTPLPGASTDPRPTTNHTLAQVVGREDISVVGSSDDTVLRSAHPHIRSSNAIPVGSMENDRQRGPLSDNLPQHDALGAAPSGCPRDYSISLENEAQVLASPADHNTFVRGFTSACGNLQLSLGSRDKPRRLLHDHDSTYVVTAHGNIDQVSTMSVLKVDRNIRSPSLPFEEFIDDSCVLSHQGESIIILGHAREKNQISLLSLGGGQVSRQITLWRDRNTAKRPGVSAMTSLMSPLKFASGGYDHRVHLWDIAQDFSGASAVELGIKHVSLIHSLLPIVDTSHKLVSVGADRDVPVYDLSAERVVRTLKTSCAPYHAHRTDSPFCTLLEVAHLETQFEIRDHRTLNQVAQKFGFLTDERRGRFEKADSWSHFVVCGDKNGTLHLWDLRNVSTEVALRQCFNDPVMQVINTGTRLLACSKRNELACINFQGEQ